MNLFLLYLEVLGIIAFNFNLNIKSYENTKFISGTNIAVVNIWQASKIFLWKLQKICEYNCDFNYWDFEIK